MKMFFVVVVLIVGLAVYLFVKKKQVKKREKH
jgi:uncharacterized protein YneF (UPF0154 family)